MKPRNKALTAQEKYLETGDQKYLVEMYNHLNALGWTLQQRDQELNQDPDTVLEITSSVVLQLLERKEPVINSAPSAYMKAALYYQNKPLFYEPLDSVKDLAAEEVADSNYQDYIDGILSVLSDDTEEAELVKATLEGQIDWHRVYRNLSDEKLKHRFWVKMTRVKDYAKSNLDSNRICPRKKYKPRVKKNEKNNLQSNGVLPVGNSTEQVLC